MLKRTLNSYSEMDLKVKMIVADVMEMVRKVEQTVITDASYGALP